MEEERLRIQHGLSKDPAGPASGAKQSSTSNKQKFLRGHFEKPYEIWAHDDGGIRRSEGPNKKAYLQNQTTNQI